MSTPLAWAFLDRLLLPVLLRSLHAVRILGAPTALDATRPLLIVANHASWWDGFLVQRLARRLRPVAQLHTIMLERELRRAPFLRHTGALGLVPGSLASTRSLLKRLHALRRASPELVVQVYPQGRIVPSRRRPLGFQRGVGAIARALVDPIILPVGLHLEPLNHPRPTAFVVCGPPVPDGRTPSAEELEDHVTRGLDRFLARIDEAGEHWSDPTQEDPQ
ncbi:MAG: lysophospholipid acyltransferase family protein [Gemmatimonadota bacterium]